MLRVPQYPPLHARMIRLEDGPPMYRMLGYADANNIMSDLPPSTPGYLGPFAAPLLQSSQGVTLGLTKFGLPLAPLPFTTLYYDDRLSALGSCVDRNPRHRMASLEKSILPDLRLQEALFPEMAVPGTGVNSREANSGFLYRRGLPPCRSNMDSTSGWMSLNLHAGFSM